MNKYLTEEAVTQAINLAAIENVADANHNYAKGFRDAVRAVEELPESIVRCKDCAYGRYDIFGRGMFCGLHLSSVFGDVKETDFCSFAREKE